MAKKSMKRWVYGPAKPTKPEVLENIKSSIESQAQKFVDSELKPQHIKPAPEDERWNYLVDIYVKWYRNYFYFCSKYCSPGPNAISPYFEDKFARLEYVGENLFNLSYMRHTGQWWEIYQELTFEECLTAIRDEPHFQP